MPFLHPVPNSARSSATRRPPRLRPAPSCCRRRGRRLDVLAIAVAAIVNERFLDPLFTLSGLARELNISTLALRVRFRRFYGLTLEEHLALRRIELASMLMASTPHTLGALEHIARGSGYSGTTELDRDFLRYRRTPALAAWFRVSSRRPTLPAETTGPKPLAVSQNPTGRQQL